MFACDILMHNSMYKPKLCKSIQTVKRQMFLQKDDVALHNSTLCPSVSDFCSQYSSSDPITFLTKIVWDRVSKSGSE